MIPWLGHYPLLDDNERTRVAGDFNRFAQEGLPADLRSYLLETYRVDIGGEYADMPVKNPFGKASGQFALNMRQVQMDADAGLGFVVLKTVIAQDATGTQAMAAWAIRETRMHLEPIAGKQSGKLGWTVTWTGRGWHESFESYLKLVQDAAILGKQKQMVVAPSCKYHLPGPGETEWRVGEYEYTTRALLDAWKASGVGGAMPLEKDFSPTLAGSDLASQRATVLSWMSRVVELVRAVASRDELILGIKVMNIVDTGEEQWKLLEAAIRANPDFLVYANRLFDPNKAWEGKQGVAYGGPDLSTRNLQMLARLRESGIAAPPISGTGDVHSGRIALEYALLGARSVQMHTLFQVPDHFFAMRRDNKTAKVIHHLVFDPLTGLLPWLLHLRTHFGGDTIRWLDAPKYYNRLTPEQAPV